MNLSNLPDIEFANKDVETIISDTIAYYEEAYFEQTGNRKKLYPGDPIRIFLYSQALREFQLRQIIDFSAKQNLLKYAKGDYLENLAALRTVERLPSNKASVNVKFKLSAAQPTIQTIPIGTRVTPGNDILFELLDDIEVLSGQTEIIVKMVCTLPGKIGNDFTAGQINTLVDPIPWIDKVANIDTSQGGSDEEDDNSFRERIYLAPESYSVAGPTGAYVFFAKEYSSAIKDVKVFSPSPGSIDIRILLHDGELPSESFIQHIHEYLSDKKRRPLTDNVIVSAPEVVNYSVDLTYYILEDNYSNDLMIHDNVNKAVADYILWQKSKIGRDINPSELITRIILAGGKRVEVASPLFTQIQDTQIAYVENININYGGAEND